ncbi:MAG: Hpt domain [Bacteroidota bacterium]|jgi:HPt (histidine-containing phosphotransfer) domain-containing protein
MKTSSAILNLDYLHLMTDGDPDMLRTMVRMLQAELPEAWATIQSAHAKEDWDAIQRTCHQLKASLPFTGHQELEATNKALESAARLGKAGAPAAGILLQTMAELIPAVVDALQDLE